HFFFGIGVDDPHGGAEQNLTAVRNGFNINHLSIGQFALDILNPAFNKPLLLTGSMVFSVFFQITMLTGFRNRRNHLRTINRLQALQLITQRLFPFYSHGKFLHTDRLLNSITQATIRWSHAVPVTDELLSDLLNADLQPLLRHRPAWWCHAPYAAACCGGWRLTP